MMSPSRSTARALPSPLRLGWAVTALVACALMLYLAPQARAETPAADDPPNVMVQKVADQVLTRIKNDGDIRAGSQDKIQQAIDQLVLPYVDFDKTTRLAVGRYWRQANPQQQAELVSSFRNMLVRTYSGALTHVTDEAKVDVRPFRADPGATDVVVHTVVSDGQRDPVPVDYRLEKSGQGWKIYDLNVLGVWFIENYRNQFGSIVSQGGIDGLIKALQTQSARLQPPPAGGQGNTAAPNAGPR